MSDAVGDRHAAFSRIRNRVQLPWVYVGLLIGYFALWQVFLGLVYDAESNAYAVVLGYGAVGVALAWLAFWNCRSALGRRRRIVERAEPVSCSIAETHVIQKSIRRRSFWLERFVPVVEFTYELDGVGAAGEQSAGASAEVPEDSAVPEIPEGPVSEERADRIAEEIVEATTENAGSDDGPAPADWGSPSVVGAGLVEGEQRSFYAFPDGVHESFRLRSEADEVARDLRERAGDTAYYDPKTHQAFLFDDPKGEVLRGQHDALLRLAAVTVGCPTAFGLFVVSL